MKALATIISACMLASAVTGVAVGQELPLAEERVSRDEANRTYFTDTELVNQDGQTLRFYTDVLKGKVVAINFFFTSCTTVCPPLMAKLSDVQVLLGDRIGKDIAIVSISIDPATDTPEVIKAYSEMFRAREGWVYLTGKQEDVDEVTQRLGNTGEAAHQHSAIITVGNPDTGHWVKLAPSSSVRTIARQLMLLAAGD